MINGTCPKCGGHSIYTNQGITANYGERTYVYVSSFRATKLEIYICTDCRYVEEYVSQKENIERVIKKWNKVPGKRF